MAPDSQAAPEPKPNHFRSTAGRRLIVRIAAAAAVLALVILGLWPDPIPVSTHVVSEGPLSVTFRQEGRTRFQERSLVSSPSAGWLSAIAVRGGDSVQTGDPLAVLRSAAGSIPDERQAEIAQARLESARLALTAALDRVDPARRQLAFNENELRRVQDLRDSGIGTRQQLEAAELAADQARSTLESAESEVKRARLEVRAAEAVLAQPDPSAARELVIRSPADGVVLRVFDQRDRLVGAGEPLLEVGSPGSLEVVADVLSRDAVSLQPGMPIRVARWGGEGDLLGRVTRVEPGGFTKVSALGVEEQRVVVAGELTGLRTPSNGGEGPAESIGDIGTLASRLGDGYRVDVEFEIWGAPDIRQVPASALFRTDGGWAVFTVDGDGRAARRRVRVGRSSGVSTQILDGLEVGETVILNPDERIEDGVRTVLIGS